MKEEKLLEKKRIDMENGFTCGYVKSINEGSRLHCHDYYELLLIKTGNASHVINSKKQELSEGNLLFIRDFDVHDFVHDNDAPFEYIYIAMSKKLFMSLLEYLGDDFPIKHFLVAPYPPTVSLTPSETEDIVNLVAQLDQINNKLTYRLKVKTLLSNVFVNYFIDYDKKTDYKPAWLEMVYKKMKSPNNFIAGTKKMLEISGKSREHLTRSLKKYYNMTPSEYVNDLRLEYCVKLLTKDTAPIVDICYRCGFENLSWFYKSFQQKYGTTPAKYRKKHESAKNPSSLS